MRGCACGFRGDPLRGCRCTPHQLAQYHTRLSGPLLDRIDLHIEVAPIPYRDLGSSHGGESSAAVGARVAATHERQRARFDGAGSNAEMSARDLQIHARPDGAGAAILERAMSRLGLSARAYTRILRVAQHCRPRHLNRRHLGHVAEAIQYRTLDRREAAT